MKAEAAAVDVETLAQADWEQELLYGIQMLEGKHNEL